MPASGRRSGGAPHRHFLPRHSFPIQIRKVLVRSSHVKGQREKAEKFLTRRKCKALFGKIDSACQPLSRASLTLSLKSLRESQIEAALSRAAIAH